MTLTMDKLVRMSLMTIMMNYDIDDHNDDHDDDDKGAAGNGQAGRNVPRESAPIITSVVNPRTPLHLVRSDYIDHFYDYFH